MKDLWLEYTVYLGAGSIPICGLCGNSGIVNTRPNATTPSGILCGAVFYCICPNGRTLKKRHKGAKYGGSSIL